ncbi:hypothetical protein CEP51_012824 [Fusarium floridanum]|uniref:LysM domain-containing protein n=1 Tax=Fusarium floridanum TaxID=1325733 RepID=A0A428QM83_9HYPO|nr:hypothetical protein CEP51_012824 [Fusarium floridanum]
MLSSSLLAYGLLAVGATALRGTRVRRQDGPVASDIASDCTWWDTAFDETYDCQYFEDSWWLDHKDFMDWNPSLKSDCSGIVVGNSYCVEVNDGLPRDTDKPTSTTSEPEPTGGAGKPSPTQDGLIESCVSFYLAENGDTCSKIIAKYGTFKFQDFLKWNPAVEDDCSGLWAKTYYCVGVPGTPTEAPTNVPSLTGNGKPSPTQDGLIDSCTDFYLAKLGDTCSKIVKAYGTFNLAEFLKWNPAVEKDCSGLWAKMYYCVGIPGTSTKEPTKTTADQPKPTNGIATPSPVQDGMVKNCNKFHKIMKTTICANIERYYSLPLAIFYKWNPAVGTSCTSLLVDYYVCVSTIDWTPPKATTTTKAPTPTNRIATPSPIQDGMVKNCNKFHKIMKTTTCANIERYYNLPLATFYQWNPAVGTSCTSLLVDYYVCVSVVGWTPPTATMTTKVPTPTNGIATPSPVQAGITKSCNKFHLVSSTTTCTSIQNYYKITMAQLSSWNPAVGSTCNGLWANYHVCVGVLGQTPTQPDPSNPTPSPVQAGMIKNCKKFHLVATTTTCDSIQKYYKITMAQLRKWNPAIDANCNGLWAKYYVCVQA